MITYRPRAIDPLISDLLAELPALLIVGPRATGKTTTASRHAETIVHLDRPAEAAAFKADPDAALRGLKEPVLLDEWQAVPEILGAIKRAVDATPRPGRYLLTGSVRGDLDAPTWPGTGRLVRVALFGLSVAETQGTPSAVPLLDRLAWGQDLEVPSPTPDLRGYVELALRSGFPQATLALSENTRRRWLESYLDQLLTRDAMRLEGPRDPAKLRRFFEAYALNSAGVVKDTTLIDAVGVNRKTALAYEALLINLMIIERVSPWISKRLKRLIRAPKRYLTDPGLMSSILGMNAEAVLRDGDVLGRLIETFVRAQLRAELEVTTSRPRLYHLRQEHGRHEIDLVAEYAAGEVVGIEIKADAAPQGDAAKHLVWLRDRLGDRFLRGIVLHTGPQAYPLDKQIMAVPISTLWV